MADEIIKEARPCKTCSSIERYADGRCKACAKIAQRAYYLANKDRLGAVNAAWRAANPDKVRKNSRKWTAENQEKSRAIKAKWANANPDKVKAKSAAYYQKNSAKLIAAAKAWDKQNRDKANASDSAWRAKNHDRYKAAYTARHKADPERFRAIAAAWRRANPEAVKASDHRRRAVAKKLHVNYSRGLIARLLKLQKGMCPCCRQPLGGNFHMDHIIPIARGGTSEDDNIQLLRAKCNQEKSAKHPIDFMQSRGFLL